MSKKTRMSTVIQYLVYIIQKLHSGNIKSALNKYIYRNTNQQLSLCGLCVCGGVCSCGFLFLHMCEGCLSTFGVIYLEILIRLAKNMSLLGHPDTHYQVMVICKKESGNQVTQLASKLWGILFKTLVLGLKVLLFTLHVLYTPSFPVSHFLGCITFKNIDGYQFHYRGSVFKVGSRLLHGFLVRVTLVYL